MYEYYCIGNIGNLEADTKDKLKDNEPQADSMTLVGKEEGTREVNYLKIFNKIAIKVLTVAIRVLIRCNIKFLKFAI